MKFDQKQDPKEIKPSVKYNVDDNTGSIVNEETGEVLASIMHEGGYWFYDAKGEFSPDGRAVPVCDEVLDFINNPVKGLAAPVMDAIRQARQHAQLENLNRRHDEGIVSGDDYESKRAEIFLS